MNRLPIDLCLPLMKYSYAEADTAQDSIIWNHYTAVGLCLLLRGDNDGHGVLQMDIVEKMTTKVSGTGRSAVTWSFYLC